MTIGNRIGNWVDRQVQDARDILSFSYENIRGNNPPNPGRRQFVKGTAAALLGGGAGGAAGGYALADDINSFLDGDQQDPSSGNGQTGDSGGEQNGGTNGGDTGNNDESSDPVDDTDPESESIYEVLDDSGDTDIEIMEDWLGDAYDRGHDVDDIVMGYSDSRDEDYLGFQDNGDVALPLYLTDDKGYSNSEVDTLRDYDEEGKLPEVLEPAV